MISAVSLESQPPDPSRHWYIYDVGSVILSLGCLGTLALISLSWTRLDSAIFSLPSDCHMYDWPIPLAHQYISTPRHQREPNYIVWKQCPTLADPIMSGDTRGHVYESWGMRGPMTATQNGVRISRVRLSRNEQQISVSCHPSISVRGGGERQFRVLALQESS